MERYLMEQAVERVRCMECCFDVLQEMMQSNSAAIHDPSFQELLQVLIQYYEGGQWLADYELDEAGMFPSDLKRGVLAQDALYNFFERITDTE